MSACDSEASRMRRPWTTGAVAPRGEKNHTSNYPLQMTLYGHFGITYILELPLSNTDLKILKFTDLVHNVLRHTLRRSVFVLYL